MPPRNLMLTLQEFANRLALSGQFFDRNAGQSSSRVRVRFLLAAAFALSAAMGLVHPDAQAAGLGRLSVHSDLGQPLKADVEVPAVGSDEAPSLQVHLASQAAFKQANLDFNPALTQLRFDLEARADGTYVVHITSAQAITEPYLDVLLELTWSAGRVLREYTVLLDPPGLRQTPQIIAPLASPAPAVAAEAPPAPQPEVPAAPVAAAVPPPSPAPEMLAPPTPAPEAPAPSARAPEPEPAPVAQEAPPPAPAPAPRTLHVKSGDTLGSIALESKAPTVSLDQMLVALLRANPKAFINGNINLLLAGQSLTVPSADAALNVDPAQAHREVAAQSADFAAYRSRLAQTVAAAPAEAEKQATAAGAGRVTTKVEDKSAAQKTGDQLKIAKAAEQGAAGATGISGKDEEIARQRAVKEEQDRAAALAKANADIKRANELAAKAAAAAQEQAEAAKAAAAKAEAAKAEAARVETAKAEAARAEAAKAEAAKAEAAKAEAAKAEAAKAEAAKAEAAKTALLAQATAPKAEAPKAEPPKVMPPPPAPAAPSVSLVDSLTSPVVLGSGGAALLVILIALNVIRRKRSAGADQLKTEGEALAANSLFGAAGGQSVDTGATSSFNSSFIPAASQLDSNEVDPVAEADVYVAYGREEQAEDILKEALRLQPDRHAVRVKLLEIYSRRNDKASFNAVAQELRDRTGGVGEDWDRAAKLGRTLDPANAMYAGAAAAAETGSRGPTTDLRLGGATGSRAPEGGELAETGAGAHGGELEFDTISHMVGDKSKLRAAAVVDTRGGPETALAPVTTMPVEATGNLAPTTRGGTNTATQGFEPKLPPEVLFGQKAPAPASPVAAVAQPAARAAVPSSIDFGALDFDLGPSKLNIEAQTELPVEKEEPEPQPPATVSVIEPPTIPSLDLMFPTPAASARPTVPPTVTGSAPVPNIDLNLPGASVPRTDGRSLGSLEEALSRPTLVGAVGSLSDDDVPRLNSNTDQATVPLIDFDLTGADAAMTGRRTETQAGSPMASQMATKLDLARGYIDLGVKDGARELLEEVMKDGTREQRQAAVELIKLVEA